MKLQLSSMLAGMVMMMMMMMMIVLFIVLFQNQTSYTFEEGTYSWCVCGV